MRGIALQRWQSSFRKILIWAGILMLGWLAGYYSHPLFSRVSRASDYPFVNPLAGVRYPREKEPTEFIALQDQLTALVSERTKADQADSISIYFRAFGSGQWLGVSENATYAPASLLKIPLLVAYYKLAQIRPEALKAIIPYTGGPDLNAKQSIRAAPPLEPGSYTVEELLRRMIVFSGNNSTNLLESHLDPTFFKEVYTDLGLPFRTDQGDVSYMSPKSYALMLRALYNATYLNRALSNQALGLLNEVVFRDGLVAGVPADVRVAHKFGERGYGLVDGQGQPKLINIAELHDCGIIYYPENPYILCVMTRGKDFNQLADVISSISRLTYATVSGETR